MFHKSFHSQNTVDGKCARLLRCLISLCYISQWEIQSPSRHDFQLPSYGSDPVRSPQSQMSTSLQSDASTSCADVLKNPAIVASIRTQFDAASFSIWEKQMWSAVAIDPNMTMQQYIDRGLDDRSVMVDEAHVQRNIAHENFNGQSGTVMILDTRPVLQPDGSMHVDSSKQRSIPIDDKTKTKLEIIHELRLTLDDVLKTGKTRAERRQAQNGMKKAVKMCDKIMHRIVANADREEAADARGAATTPEGAEADAEKAARVLREQADANQKLVEETELKARCDATVSALAAFRTKWVALNRAKKAWQRLAAKLVNLERHHAAQTEHNRQESEERRRVRAAADAAAAARQPKAFTARGESHRQVKAWPVDPLAPTGAADRAREEARKHTSIEEAHAHERALEEKEAARVAALEEKREAVRIGNAIVA